MKKIAINGTMLNEKPNGIGIYGINVINGLENYFSKREGFLISVFSPSSFGLSESLNIVPAPKILKSSRFKLIAALYRFYWNQISFFKFYKKFDLVFCFTAQGNFFLKNQVMVVHDLLALKMKGLTKFQRFYFKNFLPFLLRKTKAVITISEATRKDIIQQLKIRENKVHVVPCGYNKELYYPESIKSSLIKEKYGYENYFLAVGPSFPHKNFERLILAYSELEKSRQDENPLLIIGGFKAYINTLKKYVEKINPNLNVVFLGYIPLEDLPVFYRNAIALVFPSFFEGFGLPPLEAMASGCPVICSGTSSMPEVCGDAAYYFDPYNHTEIVVGMKKILDDSEFRQSLISKGLLQAERFSWESTCSQIGDILITCID